MRYLRRLALTAALLALILTACSSSETGSVGGAGGYKIGVNLELTGPASVWGEPQIHAIEMLVDQINQNGGINGRHIQLIKYDNQSKETESLVVAKKLVEQDQVLAIIGAGTTPTTMPLVPYVNQKRVPLVSVGSGDAIASPASERKWVFKTPVSNESISKKICEYLKQKGWNRVAFLSVNNAYGDSGKKEFQKVAQQYGIQIVASERFGATDNDMKPQLTSVKGKNPAAIVVWAIPPAASLVLKGYYELALDMPIFFSSGAGSNKFVELAGKDAAEGVYQPQSKIWVVDQLSAEDPQKPIIEKYVRDYQARYGSAPSPIDGMAYDAALLIVEALKSVKGNVTRESLRDAIERIDRLEGITGIFHLSPQDHVGLTDKDLMMLQFRNGRWTIAQ
jgi:branched-chain amino acid transport system substrate-binding protein